METKDAGEEEMERNNRASQNSQRVVQLKKEEDRSLTSTEDIIFLPNTSQRTNRMTEHLNIHTLLHRNKIGIVAKQTYQ